MSRNAILLVALLLVLFIAILVNIAVGSVSIPFTKVFSSIFYPDNSTFSIIVQQYRLPKTLTAICVGMALSVSGMLLQTLFRNPLAGPYILGISSGSGLGVAILIMGSSLLPYSWQQYFTQSVSVTIASAIGSIGVLILIALIAQRIQNTLSILIIGLMIGNFTGAVVNLFSYFGSAENLQKYMIWNMGSLAHVSGYDLGLLSMLTLTGLLIAFTTLKNLNVFMLGERYAQSMGVPLIETRIIVIVATGLLTGTATSFVGPIAFIGLAVPHIARLLFQTAYHQSLFWANIGIGAILLLVCDTLSQTLIPNALLPINTLTGVVGAPVVIYFIIKQKNK